jgi:hypothetical protein
MTRRTGLPACLPACLPAKIVSADKFLTSVKTTNIISNSRAIFNLIRLYHKHKQFSIFAQFLRYSLGETP